MKFKPLFLTAMVSNAPTTRPNRLSFVKSSFANPKADEVLVKLAASGLCHSDLSVINGDRSRQIPMVLGHEAAGVVEKIGEGVTDLVPGDHVVCVFVPNCGHCQPCAEGGPPCASRALRQTARAKCFPAGFVSFVMMAMSIIIAAFQLMRNMR